MQPGKGKQLGLEETAVACARASSPTRTLPLPPLSSFLLHFSYLSNSLSFSLPFQFIQFVFLPFSPSLFFVFLISFLLTLLWPIWLKRSRGRLDPRPPQATSYDNGKARGGNVTIKGKNVVPADQAQIHKGGRGGGGETHTKK